MPSSPAVAQLRPAGNRNTQGHASLRGPPHTDLVAPMRFFKRRPAPRDLPNRSRSDAPLLTLLESVTERQLGEQVEADIAIGIIRATGLPTRYPEAPAGWSCGVVAAPRQRRSLA